MRGTILPVLLLGLTACHQTQVSQPLYEVPPEQTDAVHEWLGIKSGWKEYTNKAAPPVIMNLQTTYLNEEYYKEYTNWYASYKPEDKNVEPPQPAPQPATVHPSILEEFVVIHGLVTNYSPTGANVSLRVSCAGRTNDFVVWMEIIDKPKK